MKNAIHFNAPYLIDANGKNIPCDLKVSKKIQNILSGSL